MKIQVIGPGCWRCHALAENAEQAAKALGLEYELEHITDLTVMAKLGIMMTPALIVDGEVKVSGKVPSADEIKAMLA